MLQDHCPNNSILQQGAFDTLVNYTTLDGLPHKPDHKILAF